MSKSIKIDPITIETEPKSQKPIKGLGKLLAFFRIAPNKEKQTVGMIEPTYDKKGKETNKYAPINLPPYLKNAYEYIVNNLNTSIYQSNLYRLERYKDCKFACTSEPILNTAVNIYISEAFNPVNGKKAIQIHAKNKKVEQEFYKWFDKVGFTDSVIRACLYNLVVYGDNFWVNNITENGVEGITLLDPFLVANRIEFNIGMVNQMKQWSQTALNICNTYSSLKQIYDLLNNDGEIQDISKMYKSYLLGYELKFSTKTEDQDIKGVPPWAVTHCRMFTTENDFFPFGKPILLYAIPSFKSYRTTQMLIDMLRCASFPREVFDIKGEENMDIFTRQQRVDEVREFLQNITPKTDSDDLSAVGSRIFSFSDLFEYDVISPDIDLDALGDLEYKKNDMITSTGIPDAYLNPSEGAGELGGENAEALKYLNKIFSTRCESLREAFLEGVTETFRIHLMLANIGDGKDELFELSMPNNVEDYNSDKIESISDAFGLAKDIIDSIASCAGLERGESVDKAIVKDVLRKFLPIESDVIDKWITKIYNDAEEQKEQQDENEEINTEPVIGTSNILPKSPKHESTKKFENVVNSEKMEEIYFTSKQNLGFINGNFGNRTFFNNSNKIKNDKYSAINMLFEQINLDKKKKIQESLENS